MKIDFNNGSTLAPTRSRAKLADPRPPQPPAPPVALAQPKTHYVVRWMHDGRVLKTGHATREAALEYGRASHYATVYKYAVTDGRDIIEKRTVCESED